MLHRIDPFRMSTAFAVLPIVALANCSVVETDTPANVGEGTSADRQEEPPGGNATPAETVEPESPTELVYVFEPPSQESLESIIRPDLREELLAMADVDQSARGGSHREGEELEAPAPMGEIDESNTIRLRQIVGEVGWPTRSMVGDDGTRAAWLLVQHADHDPEWQERCLSLMREKLEEDEVFPVDVAYLTDRVRVNTGKRQVYGTQFHRVEGRLVPRPMEDPDRVNDRRAEMGMGTLDDYRKMMKT